MSQNKKKIGVVISTKSKKTVTVSVQIKYNHSKYVKTLIKSSRYMAHDEKELCKEGDIILIEKTSPISRCKTWLVKKIFKRYN